MNNSDKKFSSKNFPANDFSVKKSCKIRQKVSSQNLFSKKLSRKEKLSEHFPVKTLWDEISGG
jgi:hypothetical protein